MRTKTIGEILRTERLSHRVSLEFLAKKTKIKLEYLKALENDDFPKLPAGIYIRSFIKSYSKIFGLDHKPLLAILRRDFKEDQSGQLILRDNQEIERPKRFWTPASLLLLLISGIFLTLILFIIYKWYLFNQPPNLEIFEPQDNQEVSAQVLVSGQTDLDAAVKINSQNISLQPDGSFETEILVPREGINTITIEAIDSRQKVRLIQKTIKVKF